MKIRLLIILQIVLSCLITPIAKSQGNYKAITNGIPWFDNNGNVVNAHGSCIVEEKGKYYLFGEYKSDTANVFTGFSCYSSEDLMNWKFEKIVLGKQSDGLLGPDRIGERVKVMKCPDTGEFVMYMHTDDRGYNDPHIGYATSKTINGDYEFQGALLHEGEPIRRWDMGTFQDTDGKGYLLIHHGVIYELSSDYKTVKRLVTKEKEGGESPAMFKSKGVYYWLSSNLTSWERNDNLYMTANSLEGPWTKEELFAPEGSLTWNSQCSFVFPKINKKDTVFMYMGDRWSFPFQGSSATQVWLPLKAEGTRLSIPEYWESWDIETVQPKNISESGRSIENIGPVFSSIWKKTEKGQWASNRKGSKLTASFYGTQIAITGESNPHGGYALVKILDKQGQATSTLLIDFYSKVKSHGIRYLSPVLPKGEYTVEIEVTGQQPVWYDKSKNRFGSDDYFVTVKDILVMK